MQQIMVEYDHGSGQWPEAQMTVAVVPREGDRLLFPLGDDLIPTRVVDVTLGPETMPRVEVAPDRPREEFAEAVKLEPMALLPTMFKVAVGWDTDHIDDRRGTLVGLPTIPSVGDYVGIVERSAEEIDYRRWQVLAVETVALDEGAGEDRVDAKVTLTLPGVVQGEREDLKGAEQLLQQYQHERQQVAAAIDFDLTTGPFNDELVRAVELRASMTAAGEREMNRVRRFLMLAGEESIETALADVVPGWLRDHAEQRAARRVEEVLRAQREDLERLSEADATHRRDVLGVCAAMLEAGFIGADESEPELWTEQVKRVIALSHRTAPAAENLLTVAYAHLGEEELRRDGDTLAERAYAFGRRLRALMGEREAMHEVASPVTMGASYERDGVTATACDPVDALERLLTRVATGEVKIETGEVHGVLSGRDALRLMLSAGGMRTLSEQQARARIAELEQWNATVRGRIERLEHERDEAAELARRGEAHAQAAAELRMMVTEAIETITEAGVQTVNTERELLPLVRDVVARLEAARSVGYLDQQAGLALTAIREAGVAMHGTLADTVRALLIERETLRERVEKREETAAERARERKDERRAWRERRADVVEELMGVAAIAAAEVWRNEEKLARFRARLADRAAAKYEAPTYIDVAAEATRLRFLIGKAQSDALRLAKEADAAGEPIGPVIALILDQLVLDAAVNGPYGHAPARITEQLVKERDGVPVPSPARRTTAWFAAVTSLVEGHAVAAQFLADRYGFQLGTTRSARGAAELGRQAGIRWEDMARAMMERYGIKLYAPDVQRPNAEGDGR